MDGGPKSAAARRRRRVLGAVGAALLGAAPTTACYDYVPVSPASVPPAEDVRVRLTPAGMARLGQTLGRQPEELTGRVAPRGDSLAVSIVVARAYRGVTLDSSRQALMLGPGDVAAVQRREFSRSRTTLVTVGSVVGVALLVRALSNLTDTKRGTVDPLPPGPPPVVRIPLRFAIP